MHDVAIVTASTNDYYPWLLNLIGSIQNNFPGHPSIFVYDLGMLASFVKELEALEGVTVKKIVPFVPYWKACYAWKIYILNKISAKIVYFLDAASEVLRPLTEIFEIIRQEGYFCVSQKHAGRLSFLESITPKDLLDQLNLNEDFCKDRIYFGSGNFGYKKGTAYHGVIKNALDLTKGGWTLGWSANEQFRNHGSNRCQIIRNCETFRHEQTLLNILFYKNFGDFKIHDENKYAAFKGRYEHPEQLIWNSRKWNNDLKYLSCLKYSKKPTVAIMLNRIYCLWQITIGRQHFIWMWRHRKHGFLFYVQRWFVVFIMLPLYILRLARKKLTSQGKTQ